MVRYSRGDALNGLSVTGMGYRRHAGTRPIRFRRAPSKPGRLGRFGTIDPSDGGDSYRYSGSVDWQRTAQQRQHQGHRLRHRLRPEPVLELHLLPRRSGERRSVPAGRSSVRRRAPRSAIGGSGDWGGRAVQNTFGAADAQRRHLATSACTTPCARQPLDTVREDAVMQTSVGGLRAERDASGRRGCGRWPACASTATASTSTPANRPTRAPTTPGWSARRAAPCSGRGDGTEFYVNAGLGFHSNDARGATITIDPATGDAADRVTPLARAKGAEVGFRSVRIPRLQTSVALWTLSLDSELIFVGDAGTTEAGRPSHRYGVEWANYYSPRPWLHPRRRRVACRARTSPTTTRRATTCPAPSNRSSRPASRWTA